MVPCAYILMTDLSRLRLVEVNVKMITPLLYG